MVKKIVYQPSNGGIIYEHKSFMTEGTWCSYERNVTIGTIRIIKEVAYSATHIYKRGIFKAPEILWTALNPNYLIFDKTFRYY